MWLERNELGGCDLHEDGPCVSAFARSMANNKLQIQAPVPTWVLASTLVRWCLAPHLSPLPPKAKLWRPFRPLLHAAGHTILLTISYALSPASQILGAQRVPTRAKRAIFASHGRDVAF